MIGRRPRLVLPVPLLALAFLLAACRTVDRPSRRGVAEVPTRALDAYYDAGGVVPAARGEERVFLGEDHEVVRILLPPRVPRELRHLSHSEDDIEILLYRPRRLGSERRPLVVMSPILANRLTLMNEFATAFTRRGFVAAIVIRKEFEFDPATAMDHAEGEFRTYVMQGRQAVDYLVTRPEVDGERLATFGVSAGATISACLAGADPRFRAHVLVLAGGPVADVLADTDEDRFLRYREALHEASGKDGAWFREELRRRLRTDPVRLAAHVDPDDVLLFLARRDTSVPFRHGVTLWEALGRPRLVVLPFGHYTSFLLLPWIAEASAGFLAGRFARVEGAVTPAR